jgi:hypothetical protein
LRVFPTGAIRDDNHNKYEYAKALDPRVLRAYLAFLHRHAEMPDGSYRPVDNWKKGMGETFIDSLVRHVMDLWELDHYGESYRPENGEPVNMVDALCAVIFNAHGWLYEHLKASASRRVDLSAGADDGHQSDSSPALDPGTPGLSASPVFTGSGIWNGLSQQK